MSSPYIKIFNILDLAKRTTPSEFKIYCVLLSGHRGEGSPAFFSRTTLVENTGLSTRTLVTAINSLIAKGLIKRVQGKGPSKAYLCLQKGVKKYIPNEGVIPI